MVPDIYSTITTESVERLAVTLARRDITAIRRIAPIADFEELLAFTTENPTPVENVNGNPVWRLESVSSRLIEAVAISAHESTMRDAGWKILAKIILELADYLYTYHISEIPRERLHSGAALGLVSGLCPKLSQSDAWRIAGFARIAESIKKTGDVPSYLIAPIDAAFDLASLHDFPIFDEAIDCYNEVFNRSLRWIKRTHIELTDVEFFNNLNLSHAGLEKVKSEWESRNVEKAKFAYASAKQSFFTSKQLPDLCQTPLRPQVVDWLELWFDRFPTSYISRQKCGADRPDSLKFSRLFSDLPTTDECEVAMSFDAAKSYLEFARYFSAYQGLDKADFLAETSGIGFTALLFPEWLEQEQFFKLALRRCKWIFANHILPDGLQNDGSLTAHHFALKCLLSFYQLACRCEIQLPQDFNTHCEKMVEALMYLSQPDNRLPNWDRCDSTDMRVSELCAVGHCVFHREDFLYIASGGRTGLPPKEMSHAFPYKGYYVMRDQWRANAQYLLFDSGGSTTRRNRGDRLNFILNAYGRPLINNGEGFSADNASDGDILQKRRCNTVIIDGKGQCRSDSCRATRVENHDTNWLSTPSFDFVEGWHKDGYSDVDMFDCDMRFQHKRSIFYVKETVQFGRPVSSEVGYFILHDLILGEGEHKLEQIFHLSSVTYNGLEVSDNNAVCTTEPNLCNLALTPVSGVEDLKVRWQCEKSSAVAAGQAACELARCELNFVMKRTLPTVMNALMYPLRAGGRTLPKVQPVEAVANPDVLATGFTVAHGQTTDLVLISDDGFASMRTSDVEFVGEYLFLRFDERGKPHRLTIINGQFLKWKTEVLVELPEPRTYYESSGCVE